MPSAAQIQAKANFKKAIDYRKKHNCSLKEAFAAVYPKKKAAPKKAAKKKIAGYVKTVRKGSKTDVIYSKAAKPTKAAKLVQQKLFGVKKKAAKKPVSSHKDTKSHNVNIRVISGVEFVNELIESRNKQEKLINSYSLEIKQLLQKTKQLKTISEKNEIKKRIDVLRYYVRIHKQAIKRLNKLILEHK